MVAKNSNCPKITEALKLSRYCIFKNATAWVALRQEISVVSEVKAVESCHYKLLNLIIIAKRGMITQDDLI